MKAINIYEQTSKTFFKSLAYPKKRDRAQMGSKELQKDKKNQKVRKQRIS